MKNIGSKSMLRPAVTLIHKLFLLAGFIAIISDTAIAQNQLAAKRMNELGPENSSLKKLTGTWDVTEIIISTPGAKPVVNKFVAERKMIGQFLQEISSPVKGSGVADFKRIFYLSFNRVEGQWKYVSIDTRNPVGLMPAKSFGRGDKGRIVLRFEPFALAGLGVNVAGQMLNMDEIITITDDNHNLAEERFVLADGTGKMWVAFHYDYVRRH